MTTAPSVTLPRDDVSTLEDATATQAARDAELTAQHFTGADRDLVSGDWAVYADGKIVGWAATQQDGESRALSCKTAKAAHENGATLREEIPCSIEFKLSAKHEPYWDIKVYHAPGGHLDAIEAIREAHERLSALFGPAAA